MQVIKDGKIVEDAWHLVGNDAEADSHAIVTLEHWNANHEQLLASGLPVGVVLASKESPDDIAERDRLPLIAIDFPAFGDGRGYSSARLLRTRLGYHGELRAVGDVLHDQLFLMKRCGITSFALKPGKDIQRALQAFQDFSVTYQSAADEPLPLFRRVHR